MSNFWPSKPKRTKDLKNFYTHQVGAEAKLIHPWTQPFIWGHSNCTPSRYSAAYFLENGWMMEISHQLKKNYYAWKILKHKYQLNFTSEKGLSRENLKKSKPWKWDFLVNQSDFGGCGLYWFCYLAGRLQMALTILILFNPAVTYAAAEHQEHLFWITCKRLKLLRKAGCLQLIQNSVTSVARRGQCCIRIM